MTKATLSRSGSLLEGSGARVRWDIRTTPYLVRIGATDWGRFEDLHDAIASARISKSDRPSSHVSVADLATGKVIIEIED
jgi:hypothetical protein